MNLPLAIKSYVEQKEDAKKKTGLLKLKGHEVEGLFKVS
jgi:hypothetical protein